MAGRNKKRKESRSQALIRALRGKLEEDGLQPILMAAFPLQREVIESTQRYKAILAARRSGKSMTTGIYLFYIALLYPRCNVLYITLSHQSAKQIMFKDVMEELAIQYGIEMEINLNDMAIYLSNGSVIRFMGLDATPNISNSVYGSKYRLVVIDECQSFRYDLSELIHKKLDYTLQDDLGSMLLVGTADNINEHNYFYQITRKDIENRPEEVKGFLSMWHVWRWTGLENPYQKEQVLIERARLKFYDPNIEESPGYRQMMLGEWCTTTASQVYAFALATSINNPERPISYGEIGGDPLYDLPGFAFRSEGGAWKIQNQKEWTFLAAVDTGFGDSSAIVIGAYNIYDPTLFIVDAYKKRHMSITALAEVIEEYKEKYKLRYIYVDPQAKQSIVDMNQRFGLQLIGTDKRDKNYGIETLNGAFLSGQVRLHADVITTKNTAQPRLMVRDATMLGQFEEKAWTGMAPLMKELNELPWDAKRLALDGVKQEHQGYENDLCDALLYLFRESRHFRSKTRPGGAVEPGSPEYYAKLISKHQKEITKDMNLPWFKKLKK